MHTPLRFAWIDFKAVILAALLFGVIVYAIHRDYGVKAAMKIIGVSFTFEAQKAEAKDAVNK